jgi:cysteine synthase A
MFIAQTACELIGHTPMLELKKIIPESPARILAKMETKNPTSIKDRAVHSMIRHAIKQRKITKKTEVVEVSSGNTAIALASIGSIMGFKVRIFMSELATQERRQILSAFGAKINLTPAAEHTKGARKRALAYCAANPNTTFYLNQHANEANGMAHIDKTGPEIWELTEGKIDAMIIGLGTSGTFDGLSQFFKNKNKHIKIIGFEPASSPVYSGGEQGKHKLIGIGPGFVADNFKRSQKNMDELILVKDEDAYEMTRKIARIEGVLVGPTSGAGVWVAEQLSRRPEYKGKTIVCIFCDTGERYLSEPGLFPVDGIEYMD